MIYKVSVNVLVSVSAKIAFNNKSYCKDKKNIVCAIVQTIGFPSIQYTSFLYQHLGF